MIHFRFPTGETFDMTAKFRTTPTHPIYRKATATLEGMVPEYARNFTYLMTSFLHIVATYDVVPAKYSTPGRIFNIISLTQHYLNGFTLLLTIKVEGIGQIHVTVASRDDPNSVSPKASIDINVDADFDPRMITRPYADKDINAILAHDLLYYRFQKAPDNGGITILPFTRVYVPSLMATGQWLEEPQLKLHISGRGLFNNACLLLRESWLNIQDIYGVVLAEGTYCRVDGGPAPRSTKIFCEDSATLVRVK